MYTLESENLDTIASFPAFSEAEIKAAILTRLTEKPEEDVYLYKDGGFSAAYRIHKGEPCKEVWKGNRQCFRPLSK